MPERSVSLYNWLTSSDHKTVIEEIRKTDNAAEIVKLKQKLPAITPSGVFLRRNSGDLIKHSGLICIDIDGGDNKDARNFRDLKKLLSIVPYIAYCSQSASGNGFFCIIPIAHPDKHRLHFHALEEQFKLWGVTIDSNCKDTSRLRFATYDPEPLVNINAEKYTIYAENFQYEKPLRSRPKKLIGRTTKKVENVISIIVENEIDITEPEPEWHRIACALANEFGEAGREIFHTVSQFGSYNPKECDEKFNRALKSEYNYSMGTFFRLAKLNGVSTKKSNNDIISDARLAFKEYLK